MVRPLLFVGLSLLASIAANAQTCTAPQIWQPPPAGDTLTGSTCGGDTTATGYCNGQFTAPGPAFIAQGNFTSSRTFTNVNSLAGPGFDLMIYVSAVAAGCGTNAPCVANGASVASDEIPDGAYFIIVTAASFDAAGQCGTFTLTSDGSFPVELQSFSIE